MALYVKQDQYMNKVRSDLDERNGFPVAKIVVGESK